MDEKTDTESWSNLHHAVAYRFTNLVHSLLEQGSEEDVNLPDEQGRTPLHLACSDIEGKFIPLLSNCESEDLPSRNLLETEQIIELLLSYGADPTILDKTGRSPLRCLFDNWLTKRYSLGILRNKITRFLRCGANANERDVNGRTLLHYVAGSPDMDVPVAKKIRAVEIREVEPHARRQENLCVLCCGILLQRPLSIARPVPQRNYPKRTPEEQLYMKEFLVKLINSGADINATDNKGNTPLHLAITAKKFDIVKELLAREVDVNVKNSAGQTPLHLAVEDGEKFERCGIMLLHKGAKANIADELEQTPVDIIRRREEFGGFLKYLILFIYVKIHPKMYIETGQNKKSLKNACQRECEDLNKYFEFQGQSLLPLLLRIHSLPFYTENNFFQTNINRDGFKRRFPNYGLYLEKKFLQDRKRLKMIERCAAVFSCFGGDFRYTETGRLVCSKSSHWESLPEELKLKILSFLSNDDLEYLEKHWIRPLEGNRLVEGNKLVSECSQN